jgi:hypothetical protein
MHNFNTTGRSIFSDVHQSLHWFIFLAIDDNVGAAVAVLQQLDPVVDEATAQQQMGRSDIVL